jgi:hypothetical protein
MLNTYLFECPIVQEMKKSDYSENRMRDVNTQYVAHTANKILIPKFENSKFCS